MNTQEKIELAEELIKNLQLKDKHESALKEIFGSGHFDSPFMDDYFKMEAFAIEQVSELIGDKDGFLGRYIYDCECGTKPMRESKGEGEESRLIDSVEKLIELIEGAG